MVPPRYAVDRHVPRVSIAVRVTTSAAYTSEWLADRFGAPNTRGVGRSGRTIDRSRHRGERGRTLRTRMVPDGSADRNPLRLRGKGRGRCPKVRLARASTDPAPATDPPKPSTADSNTSAAQHSASATSPTTSPDHYSKPAASDHNYTLDHEEPVKCSIDQAPAPKASETGMGKPRRRPTPGAVSASDSPPH